LHSNETIYDPYETTEFINCFLYFTQKQKERMKNFLLFQSKQK